jgi:TrkA domain protein
MTVYETDLPGVGKKFEMEVDGSERLVTIIHHDGKREVYWQAEPDADSDRLFTLTDSQARTFGSILDGSQFQPVDLDEVEVPLGEAFIEWVDVDPDSSLVGTSLETADIRQQTGVSVLAIQRGEETIANPEPSDRIQEEDILVILGTREEQSAFDDLLEGEG